MRSETKYPVEVPRNFTPNLRLRFPKTPPDPLKVPLHFCQVVAFHRAAPVERQVIDDRTRSFDHWTKLFSEKYERKRIRGKRHSSFRY